MRTTPCVVLAACATLAPAATTLIEETRVFNLFAQGSSDLGGDQNTALAYGADSNDDPFVPWLVADAVSATGAQSAIGSASGQFAMDIDPDRFAFSGSLTASATIFDETGQQAEGSGSAMMQVRFDLAQTTQWRLLIDASDNAGVTLVSGVNGPQIFSAGPGTTDQLHILGPGAYTLTFSASVAAILFGQGAASAQTTIDASFAVVPAPGAALLLALALPAARRRRS